MGAAREVDAALLLYHHPPTTSAPTIMEHVRSFQHSRFPVFPVNTDSELPPFLERLRFRVVVLHYSLFGAHQYYLSERQLQYLTDSTSSYKIAFFQDENRYCRRRFQFINEFRLDALYTLLDPAYHELVYGQHTSVGCVRTTLPGYVSGELIECARRRAGPDEERPIDVGYRGRELDYYMGRGAQEKREIADRFVERAADAGLRLDIRTDEAGRLYGARWYRFLARCRATLGVEAGTSVFDLDDSARQRTEELLSREPELDFATVSRSVLHEYEDKIPYRTISPRHFEAAAFRVTQVLYEGTYSGILRPSVHYLPLAKDFSNYDEVVAQLRDPEVRRVVTEQAYADLIESGRFRYERFVEEFDGLLAGAGLGHTMPVVEQQQLHRSIARRRRLRRPLDLARGLRYRRFPGRDHLARVYRVVRSKSGVRTGPAASDE